VAAANIGSVDHWVFASQSAADYLLRVYDLDAERIEIIEHGATIDLGLTTRAPDEAQILDEPLRLAFVGIGWPKKGLHSVNRLADECRDSSIEVHHFGPLKAEASPNLQLHGPYDSELLPEILRQAGIQVVLLPGPYAETFGHVMTEALIAGLPVIGTQYGALGERIRRHRSGWTVDPDDPAALGELVRHLDGCRLEVLRAARNAASAPLHSVADSAHRYAALYRADAVEEASHDREPARA
jgi:glycosyltransferase involved in cell wall biosynthesis